MFEWIFSPQFTIVQSYPQYKIDYERLIEMTVAVSVWHNDIFGQNVFLGETQIVIAEYLESGYSLDEPAPQEYQLAEKVIFSFYFLTEKTSLVPKSNLVTFDTGFFLHP